MALQVSLQTFKRSDDGATAVEFALIAPVLAFMFIAILEVSMMFFASVNLDSAAIDAARRIRTGQAQSTGTPEADFVSALCSKLDSIITCGNVFYDARQVNSYSAISPTVSYDPTTGEPVTYGFSVGGSGDIVVVRAMYLWHFNTPSIGMFFETVAGSNNRLLASTVVFQNEPYE
ncbi:MAG TPA: TadE/TadG family type IV pilus assembly protein [Magnetovibrio sp.]